MSVRSLCDDPLELIAVDLSLRDITTAGRSSRLEIDLHIREVLDDIRPVWREVVDEPLNARV